MANEHLPQEQPIPGPADESPYVQKVQRPGPPPSDERRERETANQASDVPGRVPVAPLEPCDTQVPSASPRDSTAVAPAVAQPPQFEVQTVEKKSANSESSRSRGLLGLGIVIGVLVTGLTCAVLHVLSLDESLKPYGFQGTMDGNPIVPSSDASVKADIEPTSPSGDASVEAVIKELATYGAKIVCDSDGHVEYLDLSNAEPLESLRMVQMHADHLSLVRRLRCPRDWDNRATLKVVLKLPNLKVIELHQLSPDVSFSKTVFQGKFEVYEYQDNRGKSPD